MVSKKVVVTNGEGLHLRPAGVLCKEAVKFTSKIHFIFGEKICNAKSVLSVVSASVKKGDEIEVICDGADEDVALAYLVKLIEDKFDIE